MKYSAADQKLVDTVMRYKEIEYTGVDPLDLVEEALMEGANLFVKIENVNLLTYSVKRENLDLVEYLAQIEYKGEKFDLNAHIDARDTLLTHVLRSHFTNQELAQLLIEVGADVNQLDKEGVSPLILAIQSERTSDVALLLDAGADINHLTPDTKISPFLIACQGTNSYTVKTMIEKGVDINQVNPVGLNGLMLVLNAFGMYATKEDKEQRKEIINLLLSNGIDVNTVAKSGLTALWSTIGSWKEMDRIASMGADLYAEHYLPQENSKPFAHRLMDLQVVKIAPSHKNKGQDDVAKKTTKEEDSGFFADLTRKAIFNNFRSGVKDSEGNTLEAICVSNPLLVKNYKSELISLLSEKAIDINQLYSTSVTQTHQKKVKVPFLTSIIQNFSEDEIESLTKLWLTQGKKVSLYSEDKDVTPTMQPIIACLMSGKLKTLMKLSKLTETNLDTIIFTNHANKKSYHITEIFQNIISLSGLDAIEKELATTNAILEGIEINKKNNVKSDLLKDEESAKKQFLKSKESLEKKLEIFLKLQEESANVLKHLGVDFAHVSEKGIPSIFTVNSKIVLELFEKMGASSEVKANSGDNFLVNAILTGNNTMVPVIKDKWESSHPELIAETLNQMLYHDGLNERVQQPIIEMGLSNLFSLYSKEVDNKIVVSYPYINEKDSDGNTPLLVAAANNYFYVMGKLLKAGADLNAKNDNGETPIMHAIANENFQMVKFLFENKVDINVVNNDGVTIDDLLDDVEDNELIEMVTSYINGEFNPEDAKVKFKKKVR